MNRATLERATVHAVRHYRSGDTARRKAAFCAAVVVGRYRRGATLTLAKSLYCSADTVERMARAAVTYLSLYAELRPVQGFSRKVRNLWHTLPYSHFAVMGQKWRDEDLTAYEVFAQLDTAAQHGASAESTASNGDMPDVRLPSVLDALDRLMARCVQAAERGDDATRAEAGRVLDWLRSARERAEKDGIT